MSHIYSIGSMGQLMVHAEDFSLGAYGDRVPTYIEATTTQAEKLITEFECHTPGNNPHAGMHCAACCYNTGYAPSSQEDADILNAALITAGRRPIDWTRAVSG